MSSRFLRGGSSRPSCPSWTLGLPVCLPDASSQKCVLARSAEQKLGLRASGCLERDSHLLTLMVRNIAGKSSKLTLQHHLVTGLSLASLAAGYGCSQPLLRSLSQLCVGRRCNLRLAEPLPDLLRSKGFHRVDGKSSVYLKRASKSFWEAPPEENKLGLSMIKSLWGQCPKGYLGLTCPQERAHFTGKCLISRRIL